MCNLKWGDCEEEVVVFVENEEGSEFDLKVDIEAE